MSRPSRLPRTPGSNSYREADALKFRSWLVERLSMTWAYYVNDGAGNLPALLGVEPSVLAEARELYDKRRRALGMPEQLGTKRAERTHPQLQVWFPKEVFDVWLDWCELRGMKGSVALRSLIHHYLLGPGEPRVLCRTWVWKGKQLVVHHAKWRSRNAGEWPYKEKALVPPGVVQALHARARMKNSSVHALMRGIVLDALEGRVQDVSIVESRSMYEDASRYWQPPALRGSA